MFEDQTTILSSKPETPDLPALPPSPKPFKKMLFWGAMIVAIIIIAGGILVAVKKYQASRPAKIDEPAIIQVATTTTPNLPDLNNPENATSTLASSSFSNLAIEYLSFADFYAPGDNSVAVKFKDYELPLNVKLDVLNYYDVSRKINLDTVLNELNNNGFASINNPWAKEAPDFYSVYNNLNQKQIPLLITSDFMIYYYQSVIKKSFKDIEENVFYDNLWSINKELYNAAKNRYEARLASMGNINDSILEGERLETAFFAVALELLKPSAEQVAPKGSLDEEQKFAVSETERFYFTVPPYLRDDVLQEVKLIRAGKEQLKSPVMLYRRNYADFTVPADYRANAKLNNFYLTTRWLNSVFPLNYKDKSCPDCLLDKEDWRLNLITASLISHDFSSLPELKNKWARIYKVMSFFKGLREDLNYVHYRDSLISLFGNDYKVEQLFDDQNKEALANLEKLRTKLLTYTFPEAQGGLSKEAPENKSRLGFKMLAESYWPNDYLFGRLIKPKTGNILAKAGADNVTVCLDRETNQRCNGFALDMVGLVYPIANNAYFTENTNYANYNQTAKGLQEQLAKDNIWHTTNYWSNLSLVRASLEMPKSNLPLFARSINWQDKNLRTAAAAWINLQLPAEKFSVKQLFKGQGLNSFSSGGENFYVEPNLNLVNELLANNSMLLRMFSVLQLDQEVKVASQNIQNSSLNLNALRKVIVKELQGEELLAEDTEAISDFAQQLKIDPLYKTDKTLILKSAKQKTSLKEDLSRLKLLIIAHQDGDKKVFSVGPIWDYQESR